MRFPTLNEPQRAAVTHPPGALLVLAGAGSGKTRVLTCRVAHVISEQGLDPQSVMAVTFTNRAADQMRRRVTDILEHEPGGIWLGTFHSLSARLLRREAHLLGFTRGFSIYDEDDRLSLIKRLLERRGLSHRKYPPRLIQALISRAKNSLKSPEQMAESAEDDTEEVSANIFADLQTALAAANGMDFDDLLIHPLTLFEEHPDRLRAYQARFRIVLVDEFQDTNRAQYLLVRMLAGKHRNVCVVGDDDQSIYGWRGAEVRNMRDFQNDFPGTEVVRLEQNYRSTQLILDAANSVIEENRDRLGKKLFTVRSGGTPITVVTTADERDEAEWVAREFRERMANDHYLPADFAVLYRTNAQSRAFEDAFRRVALPYRVVGAVSFYGRREVRDLIAYLRLLVNPADDQAFLRAVQVPRRGIGPGTLSRLQEAATEWRKPLLETAALAETLTGAQARARTRLVEFAGLMEHLGSELETTPPHEVLEKVISAIDYESHLLEEGPEGHDRWENVAELVTAASEWAEAESEEGETPLAAFLASAALTTSAEEIQGDPDGVTLMTVHTAKGLEWPAVVIAGMEDGLFPLRRSLETPDGAEEERRLAYVAVTRAADRLYLSWARTRRRAGQVMPGRPSRFLEAIPMEVVEERRTSGIFGGELFRKPKRPYLWPTAEEPGVEYESQDAPRYIKGERVRHQKFGAGVIRGLSGNGRNLKVVVEFEDSDAGLKELLVSSARLERDWDPA